MQPGVYRGISNDDYHSGPGDSKSCLDLVRKSPAHLKDVKNHPRASRKPTPSQAFGTALHMLLLEPELFGAHYALPFVPPEGALATIEHMKTALSDAGVVFKASAKKDDLAALVRANIPDAILLSDAREAWESENGDREEIDAETWDRLHAARDAVMAHPAARKLLQAPGESELSAYWREPVIDPTTGEQVGEIEMRCRPDRWRHDGILIDVKSTQPGDAHPEEFARSLLDWRYHVQHALYLFGAGMALAAAQAESDAFDKFAPPRAFVFLVVENDACVVDGIAKGVACYQLQPDSVALAETEIREDVFALHRCLKSGRWPGYAETVQPIELPPYAFTKAAARAPAQP